MDLHYLEIFNAIAKNASFKKASEALHISQPALSIQIKKLEGQTGLKLFNKIGNTMQLSDDGIMLYGYTKKIFAIIEEMENNISNHKEFIGGTVNLGGSNTPGTYILPNVIGEMRKLYPDVTFNLHIANTTEITDLIDNGALDVAVSGGNCNYHDNIHVEKIINDRLVIIAAADNKLCGKEYVDEADLSEASFVVHETSSQLYSSFKKFITEYGITGNISMYLGSIESIKQAVIANLGISIIPYYAVSAEIKTGFLRELKMQHGDFTYPYSLIYNKNKNLSKTTMKFIEVLRDVSSKL